LKAIVTEQAIITEQRLKEISPAKSQCFVHIA
jgi:hypothetical protein